MDSIPFTFGKKLPLIYNHPLCSSSKNFARLIKISPDGHFLLNTLEDNSINIFKFSDKFFESRKFYKNGEEVISKDFEESPPLKSVLTVQVGESIYDSDWYPYFNINEPSTCCFATTSRAHPIHLWDSCTGELRCSYSGYNHLDELDSCVSLTFNLFGDKLYGGSDRIIRCFDVSSPGRQSCEILTSRSRKDPQGQKGIISTISFNPDRCGAFAAGSYGSSVGVYVENTHECVLEMHDIGMGVTCMKWSPCGNYLWVGGRRSSSIQCWDVRSARGVVGSIKRDLSSNQKLVFDIDPWGKYIITGTQSGRCRVFNTSDFSTVEDYNLCDSESSLVDSQNATDVVYQNTCVSATLFHPYASFIVTCMGERIFNIEDASKEEKILLPNIQLWGLNCDSHTN